jgi:hypothetical protein
VSPFLLQGLKGGLEISFLKTRYYGATNLDAYIRSFLDQRSLRPSPTRQITKPVSVTGKNGIVKKVMKNHGITHVDTMS